MAMKFSTELRPGRFLARKSGRNLLPEAYGLHQEPAPDSDTDDDSPEDDESMQDAESIDEAETTIGEKSSCQLTYTQAVKDLIRAAANADHLEGGVQDLTYLTELGEVEIDGETWYISELNDESAPRLILARDTPFVLADPMKEIINTTMGQIYLDLHQTSINCLYLNQQTRDLINQHEGGAGNAEDRSGKYSLLETFYAERSVVEHVLKAALLYLDAKEDGNEAMHGELEKVTNQLKEFMGNTGIATHDGLELQAFTSDKARMWKRYSTVASPLGWLMLSILAYSPAFREAARAFDDERWMALCKSIRRNKASLEMFAKVRGLDWESPLVCIAPSITIEAVRSTFELKPDHPHLWALNGSGKPQRLTSGGVQCLNIDELDITAEHCNVEPKDWPNSWPWPTLNPQDTHAADPPCKVCKQHNCNCGPHSMFNPLVEMTFYGQKGNGVRALQRIPKKAIMAEYTGTMLNTEHPKGLDTSYILAFDRPSHHEPLGPGDKLGNMEIGAVDARVSGNWTRYMNHSCDAACFFDCVVVGSKWRMVVIAMKDIEIFDEMTIDYGDSYFTKDKLCACGTKQCTFSSVEMIEKNEARKRRRQEAAARAMEHEMGRL
ncbi:MAG: hypothetical protein M1819_004116 [Sarea resinae]|nr:MAG: hypothetical protein M1819_004116 [Sarea resinae]